MTLDQRSNKELEHGVASDEYGSRKKAFAEEILRRRKGDPGDGRRYVWRTLLVAAIGVATTIMTRFWRKPN